ncbi:uncharacterized protein RHIMIDRAFT_255579 [Rhizopus microsporus ATCC 52813]|uniref:Uncharacterized protein n=1 Tax=Rhizopus microsporus ATCC 52813 TaxID=1340429 RepID=A0A2G4SS48_RHIZD|nr:uncharacterized protein RHIMIDRAFT_255579 [Rhizopus microsporus ATCC 52813]PHZ11593.1 hypothetical protein RHIMIDRAFT_255579 [Rhizopus microsporus ATCC 52813]
MTSIFVNRTTLELAGCNFDLGKEHTHSALLAISLYSLPFVCFPVPLCYYLFGNR